jgi:hypothetical protein
LHFEANVFTTTAFLWTEEGGTINLGVPGAGITIPSGIPGHGMNTAGDVVGAFAIDPNGALEALVWHVRTPREAVEEIADDVAGLIETAGVGEGEANALVSKLDAAAARLEKGKPAEAVNVLNAFISQVKAMVRSGRLSEAEGQALIDAARAIIAQLP